MISVFGKSLNGWHCVEVDGREIPGLYIRAQGDEVVFCCSHNFAKVFTFPADVQAVAASALANALATQQGFSHAGATTKDRPFAPQVMQIELVPDTKN